MGARGLNKEVTTYLSHLKAEYLTIYGAADLTDLGDLSKLRPLLPIELLAIKKCAYYTNSFNRISAINGLNHRGTLGDSYEMAGRGIKRRGCELLSERYFNPEFKEY